MAEQQMKKRDLRAFYEVKAPLTSTKIQLYGQSPEALAGKVVSLDLTRSMRGKNVALNLRTRLDNGQLVGDPLSLEVFGSYIRRMIRNGTDYVEDSFVVKCKDCELIVKPFLITRKKVSRTLQHALRTATKEHLTATFLVKPALEIFTDVMAQKTQKELSLKLKKLYPLALCEIRILKVVEGKK